jgi:hypothetical protein
MLHRQSHPAAKSSFTCRLSSLLGAFLLCVASSVSADTTALTIANATKGTSNVPVAMPFPVTRSGDLGYATIVNYHTVDGSALAPTDYTSATASVTIPAGSANATIPVMLSANTGASANLNFQVLLDSAFGIGPSPDFVAQQTFATGANPLSIAITDVNGDGKPDLVVANNSGNTVSVLLNTTAPGAATPSFATQQTFATGAYPYSVEMADVNGVG